MPKPNEPVVEFKEFCDQKKIHRFRRLFLNYLVDNCGGVVPSRDWLEEKWGEFCVAMYDRILDIQPESSQEHKKGGK